MKHLAITTSFTLGREQAESTLRDDIGMFTSRAFKNVAVNSLATMRVQKPHEIETAIFTCTYGAGLSYEFPRAVWDSRNVS